MKKIICAWICIIMLFFLCGCSNEITEGEVCKKEYREAHTTVMLLPLTIFNGKTTISIMQHYTVHYPDRYVIFIKAYQDEEWKTADFYVSKETYDTIKIGDMFLYSEERGDSQDEPYTKERKED